MLVLMLGYAMKPLTQPTLLKTFTLRQADGTTSHSTRLPKDASQVAGYQGERLKFAGFAHPSIHRTVFGTQDERAYVTRGTNNLKLSRGRHKPQQRHPRSRGRRLYPQYPGIRRH